MDTRNHKFENDVEFVNNISIVDMICCVFTDCVFQFPLHVVMCLLYGLPLGSNFRFGLIKLELFIKGLILDWMGITYSARLQDAILLKKRIESNNNFKECTRIMSSLRKDYPGSTYKVTPNFSAGMVNLDINIPAEAITTEVDWEMVQEKFAEFRRLINSSLNAYTTK